jgi:hypothetical protein
MSAPFTLDDDTIELVLTPEQMRMLARAANDDTGPEPRLPMDVPKAVAVAPTAAIQRDRRWPIRGIAALVAATACLVALGSITHRVIQRHKLTPMATSTAAPRPKAVPATPEAAAPTPTALSPPVAQTAPPVGTAAPTAPVANTPPVAGASVASSSNPVRIRNPFDRSEVFEFPAGTSSQEARQKMVETLLERARERTH